VIGGPRFHCIKDLLFHIADVEDGWTNGDIRRGRMVQEAIPLLRNGGPDFSGFPLKLLLDYSRLVEQSTLAYLGTISDEDEKRVVQVEDWPNKPFFLGGLLWHVMIHEMRHSAQIVMLLRIQGIEPPSLDLLFYLPLV